MSEKQDERLNEGCPFSVQEGLVLHWPCEFCNPSQVPDGVMAGAVYDRVLPDGVCRKIEQYFRRICGFDE